MKRFVIKWKSETQSCIILILTTSLLQENRTAIFELVQREYFTSELKNLQVSNVVANQSTSLQLYPILEKSLMKRWWRLKHANKLNQSKHQLILPAKHHVTFFIVQNYHETSYHSGRDETSQLLDSISKVSCKKHFTKVYALQENAPSATNTNNGWSTRWKNRTL